MHRESCGGDSDCAACVGRQGQGKFKESRKHAGLTRRCQIPRPNPRRFLPRPKSRHFATRLPRLYDPENLYLKCVPAQFLAIMHTRLRSCQWARSQNFSVFFILPGRLVFSTRILGASDGLAAGIGAVLCLGRRVAEGGCGPATPLPFWEETPGTVTESPAVNGLDRRPRTSRAHFISVPRSLSYQRSKLSWD